MKLEWATEYYLEDGDMFWLDGTLFFTDVTISMDFTHYPNAAYLNWNACLYGNGNDLYDIK